MERPRDLVSAEWCAGFFDGEGCISISKPIPSRAAGIPVEESARYDLVVQLVNTHREALMSFAEGFGGSVKTRRRVGCRPLYVWYANARVAEEFLRTVLPYLIVKREQAELALEFRATFRKGIRAHSGSPERTRRVRDIRADHYERMRELKAA